jgi:Putative MetA-pathway of phenol degradation
MPSRKNMLLHAMMHGSCFTLKRVAALILLWIIASACPAEDYVDLQTDRDAFTPSTYTTKPGTVLTEGSYVYIDNRSGPSTNSYPELLCRIGVSDRFEWRIGGSYADNGGGYLVTNAEGGSGRSDGTVAYESNVLYGFKATTTEQHDWTPKSCLIVEAFTPTSGDLFGTTPVVTYAFGWQSAAGWRLDTAIRYAYSEGEQSWFNKWAPSVVLRIPVSERWEVHAEYFGSYTDGLLNEEASPFFSPGTHYLLTKNLEIGIRLGWGLTNDAASFFSDAGFGVRF